MHAITNFSFVLSTNVIDSALMFAPRLTNANYPFKFQIKVTVRHMKFDVRIKQLVNEFRYAFITNMPIMFVLMKY